MNIGHVVRFRRTAIIAYSRHPVARLYRGWRAFAGDTAAADILLLPLAGLALSLFVIRFVPDAGVIIATALSQSGGP